MAVSAAPRVGMTWLCPECGHGSPEPRDRQAHVDAHRQLREFIEAWDAAAAADQRAERRRRRRKLYIPAVVLIAVVVAVFTYWGTAVREGAPVPPSASRTPRGEVPRVEPRPSRPPVVDPSEAPAPPPSGRRAGPDAAMPAPELPASTPAPVPDVAEASQPVAPPVASADAVAGPTTGPPPSRPTVRGCLLVICVSLG